MKQLMENVEWLVAGVVILACVYCVFTSLQAPEDQSNVDLKRAKEKIELAIDNNRAPKDYPFAREELSAKVAEAIGRPTEALPAYAAHRAFYPQPMRPYVDPAKIRAPIDTYRTDTAVLKTVEGLSAKADHGRVYLSFKLPEGPGLKYFQVVRVEVFRAEKEDGEFKPAGVVEIGSEEPVEAALPAGAAAVGPEKKPEETVEDLSSAGRRLDVAPREEIAAEEKVTIPEEYKSLIVFRDLDVEPKKTYFYKARLVGRMIATGPGGLVKTGANEVIKIEVPADLTQVKPADPKNTAKLYASAYCDIASDTTPPNFVIRFAGVIGQLPPPGQAFPVGYVPDYRGHFALQVWVPEVREWKEDTLNVPVNEELKGTIRYTLPDSKEVKFFAYATGLKLKEIQNKAERVMKTRKVSVTKKVVNADGEEEEVPVMDTKLGRPMTREEQYEHEIPNQVAVLANAKTGKDEEFFKRADFEKRKEAFVYFDRIVKEQEERERAEKERIKRLMAQRKAMEAHRAEQQPQPNVVVPHMPGGGAPPPEVPQFGPDEKIPDPYDTGE